MAIKGFKDIIDNKGYIVESKDRSIFEKGIVQSSFGNGEGDMIEFVLYDANENILPQGEDGILARYLNLSDVNISDYFIITDSVKTKKGNGAIEYIIDSQKLISEAGYTNGIFKTQITLLNRRIGSPHDPKNKLWIHDISPSRTEIRVLPLKDDTMPNMDMDSRYNVFVEGKQFRDDTLYLIKPFVENIKIESIINNILSENGKITEGEYYISLIKSEFKINNFDIFINSIRDKFLQSVDYFSQNRDYSIVSINYGKPLNTPPSLDLSVKKIEEVCISILEETIEYMLPTRNIQKDTKLSPEEQVTFDKVSDILDSVTSNNIYESTVMDSTILGCMNPKALNYNPDATVEDGSCIFERKSIPIKSTFYIWSTIGSIRYRNINGELTTFEGKEYESVSITHIGEPKFEGDIRKQPKIKIVKQIQEYTLINETANGLTLVGDTSFITRPDSIPRTIPVIYEDAYTGEIKNINMLPRSSTTITAVGGSVRHDKTDKGLTMIRAKLQ